MEISVKKLIEGIRALHSKNWNRSHYNWWIISQIIGCGATTAQKICSDGGVDPDFTEK